MLKRSACGRLNVLGQAKGSDNGIAVGINKDITVMWPCAGIADNTDSVRMADKIAPK